MSTYKQDLIGTWTEDCLRYQWEHGSQDCTPQQTEPVHIQKEAREAVTKVFAAITRDSTHARIVQDLTESSEQLEALQADGPLGELAAERRALNREYIAYLTGNLNSSVMAYVQATQRDNPNMPFLLGSMLQFICDPSPCIYEYTGFRVISTETVEVAEEDEAGFRVGVSLFGNRK